MARISPSELRSQISQRVGFKTSQDEVDFELSEVTDTTVTFHPARGRTGVVGIRELDGLEPETTYEITADADLRKSQAPRQKIWRDPRQLRRAYVTTLRAPKTEQLSTIATANDVHFGKVAVNDIWFPFLGRLDPIKPTPEHDPFPELTSRAAVSEIKAVNGGQGPDLVIVKGDLTENATYAEFDRYSKVWRDSFGSLLIDVRGNHDSRPPKWQGREGFANEPVQVRDVDGARVILLDTSTENRWFGSLTDSQISDLEDACSESDRPVMIMGHHPVAHYLSDEWVEPAVRQLIWNPKSRLIAKSMYAFEARLAPRLPERLDLVGKIYSAVPRERVDSFMLAGHFALNPKSSLKLLDLIERQSRVVGYFAGHTHRNRVRRLGSLAPERYLTARNVVLVETASAHEYPSGWAEYRIYGDGIMQIQRRLRDPLAMQWIDRTRGSARGLFEPTVNGSLNERCYWIPNRQLIRRTGG